MITINEYIIEKLHVGAGMKSEISEDDLCVHPGDPEAEDACKSFNTKEVMYCKYANGRNNVGKIKLMRFHEFSTESQSFRAVMVTADNHNSNLIFNQIV